MLVLRSEAVVAVSARAVWDVLVDFASHAQWSSSARLEGAAQSGQQVTYHVGSQVLMRRMRPLRFSGAIMAMEAERRLEWTGGMAGLALLTLTFDLQPVSAGTCLRQQLQITGLGPLLFRRRFQRTFSPAVAGLMQDFHHRMSKPAKHPLPTTRHGQKRRRKRRSRASHHS